MEPGNDQYGTSSAEQWPREVGPRGWAPPQAPDGPSRRLQPGSRARTWLIVLAALLTELVVIVAADNQWVSDKIVRDEQRTNSVALRSLADSWLTYSWRLSPPGGPNANQIWGSQLALVLTVLVLTGLLVAAVVRGPVTFVRAFFGTWMAVIVATLVGGYARGLIQPLSKFQLPKSSRLTRAAFGSYGPHQATVAAGFALGLAVAVVAAIVAVTTRRSDAPVAGPAPQEGPPPEYQQPEQPPPYYGEGSDAPAGPAAPSPSAAGAPPPSAPPPPRPSASPAAADDATARYRPIDDDEDLGHPPDEGAERP